MNSPSFYYLCNHDTCRVAAKFSWEQTGSSGDFVHERLDHTLASARIAISRDRTIINAMERGFL